MNDQPYMLIVETATGPEGYPTYWRTEFPHIEAAITEMRLMRRVLRALDRDDDPDVGLQHYDPVEDIWYPPDCMPVMGFSTTTRIRRYKLSADWERMSV